jgi:hypothetical protein
MLWYISTMYVVLLKKLSFVDDDTTTLSLPIIGLMIVYVRVDSLFTDESLFASGMLLMVLINIFREGKMKRLLSYMET